MRPGIELRLRCQRRIPVTNVAGVFLCGHDKMSSPSSRFCGSSTKAGNVHVRRLQVEAAWNNRHNETVALVLNRRSQGRIS